MPITHSYSTNGSFTLCLVQYGHDIGQCTHVFLRHSEGHFEAELNVRGIVLVIRNSLTGAVDNVGRFRHSCGPFSFWVVLIIFQP